MNQSSELALQQEQIIPLLQSLPHWGHLVTIVFSGGSVFEFKGAFPEGSLAAGYYNLDGATPGFHGHLRLEALHRVRFQDKPHRGRESYAFVFEDTDGNTVFKVFLGRDGDGEIVPAQLEEFQRIRNTLLV